MDGWERPPSPPSDKKRNSIITKYLTMRYRNRAIKFFIIIHLFISDTNLLAENSNYNYDHIAASVFWNELYTYGGWTLYCGYRFDSDLKTEHGKPTLI